MNYGWGVSGNATLNTVVMCSDLRKRSAGQGALTCFAELGERPVPAIVTQGAAGPAAGARRA
ncbi:hypothetical protein ALMP_85740 [Streptomyces sp. A012304]|nr:hypothetical protein ALMP_85740 [Streptomyces sp. A012304]